MENVFFENGKFYTKINGELRQINFGGFGGGGVKKITNNIISGGGFDMWFQPNEFILDNGGLENTFYYPIVRNTPPQNTDIAQTLRYKYEGGVNATISRLAVFAGNNGTINNQLVITLMKNGIATSLTVTIPASVPVSGLMYIDAVNSVNIVNGDELSLRAQFVDGDQSPFVIYYTQLKVVTT